MNREAALPLTQAEIEHEAYENYRIPVEPFKGTADEVERQWFEQCYKGRGDRLWQLTWRAVIMGSVLGGLLSVTNIYIGLKAGWGFGVSITACILSYAIWTTIHKIGLSRTPMTILENNCMQTAASAAGYSTGGTLISAFAAYILLTNQTIPIHLLMGMVFFLAILGVTMAVPMKRQMVNMEQLKFPSGVAAAETLKALHSKGNQGMKSAAALAISGLFAMGSKFWVEGFSVFGLPERYSMSYFVNVLNNTIAGPAWVGRTVMFSLDFMFIAAGAITGMRVCLSMMIGAVTCWMIFIPILQNTINPATGVAYITGSGFRECVSWSLWAGTGCMVTSGLLSFVLQWKSALRAFAGLGSMFGGGHKQATDPIQREMDSIETPAWWFIAGQVIGLMGLTWLCGIAFGMPWWMTLIAVLLSFILAIVACRVTGETDTTPIGAMGKIMQLTFAGIAPGNMVVNLMSANITAGSAGSSAGLLTDLKSGYLLGAHPRKQFLAQFSGIFVGTLVTVVIFSLLVPNADAIGNERFPAPAALVWKAVAEALGKGINSLHPIKLWGLAIGGAIGVILPVLGMMFPKGAKFIPSAAGLGLAWTFPWYNAFMFFVGAVIGWVLEKRAPKTSADYTFTVASGLIAGESLMGAGLAVYQAGPAVVRQIFGLG
jgi:OPT family oligopeptide transporter